MVQVHKRSSTNICSSVNSTMKSFITLFAYIFIMYSDVSVFGEGDEFDAMLSNNPSLRKLYEQKMTAVNNSFVENMTAVNNSFANSFAQSKEYESFKCAIVDGRESLHRLKYEMERFKVIRQEIPRHLHSIIKGAVVRLCPVSKKDAVSRYFGYQYFQFFKYANSELAKKIWIDCESSETAAAEMAGTMAGLYPLFCDYVHVDELIEEGTPAIMEYFKLKKEGKSVWLKETLRDKNHWPMLRKDLKYLNLLRRSLEPPTYAIDYVRIKNDNDFENDSDIVNDDDVIMPLSNIDKGYC